LLEKFDMESEANDENVVILGPGTYEVGPEGSIKIYGAHHIEVRGCTLIPAPEETNAL
jgi:hypothetical protein